MSHRQSHQPLGRIPAVDRGCLPRAAGLWTAGRRADRDADGLSANALPVPHPFGRSGGLVCHIQAVMDLEAGALMMEEMSSAERPKTIGLCMIVKNEAHVILRCLDSVRPAIDYVLIEDTGSTDGTQMVVADWLAREGVPGEVTEEPWRDFAYNRSLVLAKLREIEYIDYALIIDADDVLTIDAEANIDDLKKSLHEDSYTIDIRHGPIVHQRTQICSNKRPFVFRGVVHEFLDCPSQAATAGYLSGIAMSIIGG